MGAGGAPTQPRAATIPWRSPPSCSIVAAALAKVASIIAEHDSNIENIHFKDRDGLATHINFTISVRDRMHLATILRDLRNRSVVMRVRRT